jgi:integrase
MSKRVTGRARCADLADQLGQFPRGRHSARRRARDAALGATIVIDQGVALPVVQEMLGHSDIRVTRDYVDVSSPLAQEAAARVGKALFGRTATKTATRRHSR